MLIQTDRVARAAPRATRRAAVVGLALSLMASQMAFAYTIYNAVTETLQRDPRVHAARLDLKAAEEDVGVARGGYFPQVTAEAGVDDGPTETQYQLNVRQMVYDWGRVSSEVTSTRAVGERSREELRKSESDTALDATLVYLEYLRGRDVVVIFEDYLEVLDHFINIAEARRRSRFSGSVEVDRARVESARAEAERARYRGIARSARLQFAELVGSDPGHLPLKEPKDIPVLERYGSGQALEEAIATAPTVSADQAELEQARAELDLEKARLWPQLNVEADWVRREFVGEVESDMIVALRLRSESLFGMRNLRRPRVAQSRITARTFQLDASKRDLRRAMEQLAAEEPAVRQRLKNLEEQVERSGRIIKTYEEQFLAGLRDFDELLAVTREHFNARRQRLELRLDLLRLQYNAAANLGVLTLLLQEVEVGGSA